MKKSAFKSKNVNMMNTNTVLKQTRNLLFFLLPFLSFAQVTLTGKVADQTGEAVPFANVVLMNGDGTIAGGSVSSEDGTFTVKVAEGTYTLSVTFIGYQPYKKEITLNADRQLETIVLEGGTELETVTVEARKTLIRRKVDRLVYNIENNVAASGGNVVDALKVSPGVAVNGDQITMIGKSGMRVMVDGRIVELNGEDLVGFLASIPSDDIKEIEIITNPPAKYEAEGNSGLINIVYKKGRKNSWSNRTSMTYFQSYLPRFTLRNNFSYQKDKVSLIFSVNGTTGNTIIKREGEIRYPDGPWRISRDDKWNNEDLSGRFLLDYDISEKSTIGFQYLGSVSNPDPSQRTNTYTEIYNSSNTIDSLLNNNARSAQRKNNHSLNAHFKTALDTLGKNMSIDVDYFVYNSNHERDVITQSFQTDNTLLGTIFSNFNDSEQGVDNFSTRIDFEHPLKSVNLSYGAKASFTKSTYVTQNFNTITGTPVLDTNVSDDFEYQENVQSLYFNASKQFNDKWSMQLGLRLENTQTEGVSNILNQTNTNDYAKLFPTFYVSYNANEKNNFSFNYGRRISRPLYYQLNPARTYISNVNFIEGNPQLQPSFTHNFELSHVFNRKLVTTLFLSIENDGFGEIADIDPTTNEQFFTHQNFFTHYNYGISQFYTFDKVSWWESQNSLYLIGNRSDFDIQNGITAQAQNGTRFYASSYNTFNLNDAKTIKGQINYWYSSAYKYNLYDYGQSHELDLALRIDMMQRNLQLSMGVYDIFNTSPRRTSSITNGIEQIQTMYPSNRNFRITLTYNTGNKKINVRERRFGNEDEKGRAN